MAKRGLQAAVANVRRPLPWRRKAWLLVRNGLLRLRRLDDCCGHPGEPGC